jgi:hypothetical protein
VELRFSKSGDPGIERSYRTHFVSPDISERKKREMEERLSRPPASARRNVNVAPLNCPSRTASWR